MKFQFKGIGKNNSILALFILAFILYPFLANIYMTDMMSKALIMGLFALSLDLLWGYTGVLSLGHAAFFGLGSYTCVLVLKNIQAFNPSYLAILAAILVPIVLALVVGLLTFLSKTTEIYFAIITLAVSLLFEKIAMVWYHFTGGSNGIINIPSLTFSFPGLFDWELNNPIRYYYFIFFMCLFFFIICRKLVNSSFGKVLIAIRENEQRTAVIGYNTNLYKIIIYCLSAGISGLCGAIFGPLNEIVYPGLMGLTLSAEVLVWIAVGGRGTLWGAFLGALTIKIVENLLSDISIIMYLIVLGLIFILVVLFLPKGIAGFLQKFVKGVPQNLVTPS